ncbi:hypothetical protein NO2A_03431 [Planktothrix agardhii]|jgi:hypothetical protein|nr:hypothetical protein NO2A_03431 [Planktothrix agardhii]
MIEVFGSDLESLYLKMSIVVVNWLEMILRAGDDPDAVAN